MLIRCENREYLDIIRLAQQADRPLYVAIFDFEKCAA